MLNLWRTLAWLAASSSSTLKALSTSYLLILAAFLHNWSKFDSEFCKYTMMNKKEEEREQICVNQLNSSEK